MIFFEAAALIQRGIGVTQNYWRLPVVFANLRKITYIYNLQKQVWKIIDEVSPALRKVKYCLHWRLYRSMDIVVCRCVNVLSSLNNMNLIRFKVSRLFGLMDFNKENCHAEKDKNHYFS